MERQSTDVLPRPDSAEEQRNLAQALLRNGRRQDAAGALEKAASLCPDNAHYRHDLALALAELKRPQEAEEAYRRAIAIQPEFPEALNNLGILLEGLGRLKEAEAAYRQALAIKPQAADVHNNLGVALAAQRRYEEAVLSYRESLRLSPDSALALNNLGNSLRALGEVEQAVRSLRQAIRIKPDYAEAYNNLGIALVQLGRDEEAVCFYERALHFRPDYPEAHLNRSLAWLAAGDFERGWSEYEWRWMVKDVNRRVFRQRRWDGADVHGKTLFIYLEQGVGDTLQFIRYARLLKQRGARVVVESPKPLLNLLRGSRDIDEVVPVGDPLPEFDLQVPLLSLPGVFRTAATAIPDEVPYLFAKPDLVDQWRERLASMLPLSPRESRGEGDVHPLSPGEGRGEGALERKRSSLGPFLVGIAWQGNKQYRGDRQRSIPLKFFGVLARVPGVRLVSLQKGGGADQLTDMKDRFPVFELDALDEKHGAFMDTAAVMKNLDLVITSDTAIPHLAGALGVPVWLALPKVADWRWMRSGERCPWYPTMRVFRQRIADDWEYLFETIAAALREFRGRRDLGDELAAEARRAAAQREYQIGLALAKEGKLPESEEHLARAVELCPAFATARHNLGVVQARQKRTDKAARSFEKTIEVDPSFVDAYGNLGLAYYEQGDFHDAVRQFRQSLRIGPGSAETWNNLGVALMQQAQPREAAECYRRSLELRPDYAEAHQNLGRALLTMGQFEQGWLELEWRRKLPTSAAAPSEKPRWDGSPLAGRTLLLYAEQGLGDTLQFVRLAAVARRGGGRVVLQCQPALVRLLKVSAQEAAPRQAGRDSHGQRITRLPLDEIVGAGARLPPHDVQAPLVSLPSLLRVEPRDGARDAPYLRADQGLVRRWCDRLSGLTGYMVGIAWQGNPSWAGDQYRSIPIDCFEPLAQLPDIRLISLQHGAGAEQLAGLASCFDVVDFSREMDAGAGPFMDTAALIMNLDLVVTSDTAVAHLAGALGKPVWLALNHAADWRWMLDRDDSPWYPTMRLFRQRRPGDWPDVFQRMRGELRRRVNRRVLPAATDDQPAEERSPPRRLESRAAASARITTKSINLSCPINALGYGVVGLNVLKALTKAGVAVTCWTIGRVEAERQDQAIVEEAIERQKSFDGHAPSLRIAHQHHLAQHVGRPRIGFPIFELDRFTPVELIHLRAQDQLLVTSRWAKEVVEANRAAPSGAVHVVHLGVDREVFFEPDDAERAPENGHARHTVFLSVGKWERRKGHDLLLDAFNKAFTADDDVELWMLAFNPVIGDDRRQILAKNQEWETRYRSSPLGRRIRFLPRMAERREVAATMRQADCGVFLSRAEGWNLPALEMMSCGKPLIITNYSAHTEYCNPSNAMLIDIDALEDARDERWFSGQGQWAALGPKQLEQTITCMRQVHRRKQAGQPQLNAAGIETARQFTWDAAATAILSIV